MNIPFERIQVGIH